MRYDVDGMAHIERIRGWFYEEWVWICAKLHDAICDFEIPMHV